MRLYFVETIRKQRRTGERYGARMDVSFIVDSVCASAGEIKARRGRGDRRYLTTPMPSFSHAPVNVTYSEGELAILYCSVQNLGTKTVVWRKVTSSSPLTIGTYTYVADKRFQVNHVPHRDQWNLLIKHVSVQDAGVYECQVSSKHKKIRKMVILHITEPSSRKEPEISISGSRYVEKGDSIYLMCNATGEDYPPDDLDWFKEGKKVVSDYDRSLSITKFVSLAAKTIVSILKVERSTMEDAGNYVCRTSDLMITGIKVHVINAETKNIKRGTLYQSGDSETSSSIKTHTSHIYVLAAILWLNFVFSFLLH
ncbi:hypothetical protein ScPMuIL_018377 [Solemya velum]